MIPEARRDSGADHNIWDSTQFSSSYHVPGTLLSVCGFSSNSLNPMRQVVFYPCFMDEETKAKEG